MLSCIIWESSCKQFRRNKIDYDTMTGSNETFSEDLLELLNKLCWVKINNNYPDQNFFS